jgi:hypothetical protein
MKTVATLGACQRPGCNHSITKREALFAGRSRSTPSKTPGCQRSVANHRQHGKRDPEAKTQEHGDRAKALVAVFHGALAGRRLN